jgi:PAS domain S-box-containing protein
MATAKILVVDDEIIIARELEARLAALGYEVLEIASSGQEAVELAEWARPDLVLMDIVLKGDMDGIEAAAEIRARFGIPSIYLTAYADEVTLQRAQVTEPFGYIVKPFSERELRANIEMALYKHQAESRLKSVGKWFASSMQQIGDGVIAADAQGNISFMNRVAEVLTGWTYEEAVGRRLDDVVLLFSSGRASRLDPMTSVAAESELVVDVGGDVFLVDQRSNEEIPIYLAVTPIEATAGDASGTMLVMRDISEQKRSLELLREIEERYLQTQKLEAVGLLAGAIAHEFNYLLTVISGYASPLFNKSQIDQDFRERLEGIALAGERARRLTRRLLSFSRRQVFEAKVVDLNTLVADIAQMLRQLISEDIVLITSLASALDRVRVDPGQLEQSLMNLVLNAHDAMLGGGSLTIETANVGLEESLHLEHLGVLPGHYVRVTVKDTGCGMSQEVKERIFEPFFTTKEPGSGTGLGLATVYGTVQRSHGYLTVESEPGIGSAFNIFLPAVAEEI